MDRTTKHDKMRDRSLDRRFLVERCGFGEKMPRKVDLRPQNAARSRAETNLSRITDPVAVGSVRRSVPIGNEACVLSDVHVEMRKHNQAKRFQDEEQGTKESYPSG